MHRFDLLRLEVVLVALTADAEGYCVVKVIAGDEIDCGLEMEHEAELLIMTTIVPHCGRKVNNLGERWKA